jgi:hypothetical protein
MNYPIIDLQCSQKYQLQGFSKAGNKTGFYVHGLKVILSI